MIRATVDTTLLASGPIRAQTPPGQLLAAWADGRYELVLSEAILRELARTATKPYFAQRLTPARQAEHLATLRALGTLTRLTTTVQAVATHAEDDLVLATALSGGARFLVTTDYNFLSLRQYEGVALVIAREFLGMLPGLTGRTST